MCFLVFFNLIWDVSVLLNVYLIVNNTPLTLTLDYFKLFFTLCYKQQLEIYVGSILDVTYIMYRLIF